MEIKFDAGKRLYTNAIRHRFVQGENMAESITITGPKQVGALDLSQLRMAVRVNSTTYETTVEKTLSQTVQGENISLEWVVDKMFTAVPGPVSVTLVGYGNEEEVIKITSDGILVKADDVNGTAPPESTWEQLLAEMQQFATETYQNAQAAAASEANAKASETAAAASAQEAQASKTAAAASAQEAKNAAATAAQEAAEQAAAQAAAQTEAQIRSYADDRYARALKATDGPAEELTIYPDEGSSLQITVHGDTVQEGEGDPSPSNVRPLSGVGRKMVEVVLDSTLSWTQSSQSSNPFFNGVLQIAPNTGVDSATAAKNQICSFGPIRNADGYSGACAWAYAQGDAIRVRIRFGNAQSVEELTSLLDARKEAGNPEKIWYVPADESQATGRYTYAAVSGDTYAAVGIELDGPLFDGDSVNNNAETTSGRQCAVYRRMVLYTLTGQENYAQESQWAPGAVTIASFLTGAVPVTGYATKANIVCSHLVTETPSKISSSATNAQGCGQGGGTSLYLNFGTPYDTLDSVKAYIQQQYSDGTPVQILAALETPTTTYSDAQLLIANPDAEEKSTITGEGKTSATYNKSITRAIAELQAAALALGANLSI